MCNQRSLYYSIKVLRTESPYVQCYVHSCTYMHTYVSANAVALAASNWSKARLVPPLGWTNGYAQAKANPCALLTLPLTLFLFFVYNHFAFHALFFTGVVREKSIEWWKLGKWENRRESLSNKFFGVSSSLSSWPGLVSISDDLGLWPSLPPLEEISGSVLRGYIRKNFWKIRVVMWRE